ncbi:MAG TPA: thioredoxin domain-containing protein [Candidatus Eisenbacteria bacterium]
MKTKTSRRARRLKAEVSQGDHVKGFPRAPVTLVGYGDFTNPGGLETYRTIKKIRRKMGPRLRYVFRSFPRLGDRDSSGAAEAAECASTQGRFWEMHDRLFEGEGASDEFRLSRHATDLGLDLRLFLRELKTHAHAAKLEAVRRGGVRSGVVTAPAFFINSRRHESSFGVATLLPAVQAEAGDA